MARDAASRRRATISSRAIDPPLDLTWRVVLHLIEGDFEAEAPARIAQALGVNRSSVGRAVHRLIEMRILEWTPAGDLEMGPAFARAYARRLHYLQGEHEKLRLAAQAIGGEIAVLTGTEKSG